MKVRTSVVLVGILILLTGCLAQSPLRSTAWISPEKGSIPFAATVYVRSDANSYVYHLPDGSQVETDQAEIAVMVDRLAYPVTVEAIRGEQVSSQTVIAYATNPRPDIRRPIIDGDRECWLLRPFERTLIQAVVDYRGEWSLEEIEVTGSEYPGPYSTFYPPYEAGVCHAAYHGWTFENAGIVYPVYKCAGSGKPCSPTALDEGYRYAEGMNEYTWVAKVGETVAIPEQVGAIKIAVRDEFDRLTSATFAITIAESGYGGREPDPTPRLSTYPNS